MSHFGALAAASSRYAALCGPADPRTIPWYWGRLQPQLSQEKTSPNGELTKNSERYYDLLVGLFVSLLVQLWVLKI